MRELTFVVNGRNITPDPACDFSGMFRGKETQVMAKFTFSPEWKNFVKVAAFWSILGAEYPPQALIDGETCMIPVEALNRPAFNVQILGKRRNNRLETNKLTIYQRGGKV